jgi:anaerobic selenocysteine-containing dehydrogenase
VRPSETQTQAARDPPAAKGLLTAGRRLVDWWYSSSVCARPVSSFARAGTLVADDQIRPERAIRATCRPPAASDRARARPLLMMTIRSHDRFNMTVNGLDDRDLGVHRERRVVFLNSLDIAELGLVASQVVKLIGEFRGARRVAARVIVVPSDTPRRCAAT